MNVVKEHEGLCVWVVSHLFTSDFRGAVTHTDAEEGANVVERGFGNVKPSTLSVVHGSGQPRHLATC